MAESTSTGGDTGGATSEFVAEKKKLLAKKVSELVEILKKRQAELCESVKRDVASGRHLHVFPDRLAFWEKCKQSEDLEKLLHTLFTHYLVLMEECFKGKEKYGKFQVEWMEYVCLVQYECPPVSEAGKLWLQVVEKSGLGPSASTQSVTSTSVARAVFSFCQKQILAIKEGGGPVEDEEESDTPVEEAGLTNDEAALYRLGGFALHAVLKALTETDVVSVCSQLKMPADMKVDLPSNIVHLDRGGMTFMRKEFLGYLSVAHKKLREKSTTEFIRRYGANAMKEMEAQVLQDVHLTKVFEFACREIGIVGDILPQVHRLLMKRMVHTHGNELLQSRRMLENVESGRFVNAPIMLREDLKSMATRSRVKK